MKWIFVVLSLNVCSWGDYFREEGELGGWWSGEKIAKTKWRLDCGG